MKKNIKFMPEVIQVAATAAEKEKTKTHIL